MDARVVRVGIAVVAVGGIATFLWPKRQAQVASSKAINASRAVAGALSAGDADPDAQARKQAVVLRRRIAEARERRHAAAQPSVGKSSHGLADGPRPGPAQLPTPSRSEEPDGSDPPPEIDKAYVRKAVRAIAPLLAECYEAAREEDDSLSGRLVVEFDIEAERDAGGAVERPRIHESSTLTHPSLDECITETLYTLELPPVHAGGGAVHVRYPFEFASVSGSSNE
ncbi:MAG: AgmX/PglI C-terminal domain-containing protein [Myxococcales bacterium]|nr:AgmX/PglI C-terminal domain-containing protein [Myxococcales bacterium]MDD9967372.1 AgmX/PglI C-terminal domain-containing protein [Myxococcales bacterium]